MKNRAILTKDYSISKILKGGWQLADGHSANSIDKQKAVEDMHVFVQSGITTFDFGDVYTGVEELVGYFLSDYRNKFGNEGFAEVQLHTKFIPELEMLPIISKELVEKRIDRSLKRLGVDQLDLVQLHWWDYEVPNYVETALHLTKLKRKGKIKHIGVTNFDVPRLKELVDAEVPIVSNQVQYSVLDQRPENGLVEFCQKQDIKLLCYGVVAGGFLSDKYLGAPEPSLPLENNSLLKYSLIMEEFGGFALFQEMLKTLKKIGNKHETSITNIATKYILQKPQVGGVIIGARNTNNLNDNLRVFDFQLDQEDVGAIETIIDRSQGPKGDIYGLERVKGGKHASIISVYKKES
jgi:aryl-alcohol dehydrogenase-like predicted oxidoreductase